MKTISSIFLIAICFISCDSDNNSTAMNEIDNILNNLVTENKTPSVQYILFDKDTIIHRYRNGLADIVNRKKTDMNTTFNAFSVTKTFTALAVLQLYEKNSLDINEPVIKYLPDFPYSPDITIRALMAHSGGIPNPNPLSWIHLEEEHHSFNRNEFFEQVFKKHNKTKSLANEKFSYSNLGYVLLGQLIEEITGQNYEEYIRENILSPLDLSPEELDFEIFNKGSYAKGYQKQFSFMNMILGFIMDKSKYMAKAEGKWKPFKNYYINGTPYGGLIGNPDGFRKYIQELLKNDCLLLSDEYKKLLFSENFTDSEEATGMCLSWFRGELEGQEYYMHAGGGGGYYCELRIYPELGIGSVIMFNRSGMTRENFLDKLDKYYMNEIESR